MTFTTDFCNRVMSVYKENLSKRNITPGFEGAYLHDAQIVLDILKICEELAGQSPIQKEP